MELQQYLPFTVLKHKQKINREERQEDVATVLTVYGIETNKESCTGILDSFHFVATVLTVYGIETLANK